MRYFTVLHNFEAEDNVELTVRKGETVTSNDVEAQDGWIKVEVLNDTRRHGFVPYNYIREATHFESSPNRAVSATASAPRAESAERYATTLSHMHTSPAMDYGDTFHEMRASGGVSVASRGVSPSQQSAGRAERRSTESFQQEGTERPHPGGSSLSPRHTPQGVAQEVDAMSKGSVGDGLINDPDAVVEAFMKNELHFKQLMRQRQDALHQMRTTLKEAVSELSACKEKNSVLASKLRELDQTVERERRKWKERIEEEKSFMNRSVPRENSVGAPGQGTNAPRLR